MRKKIVWAYLSLFFCCASTNNAIAQLSIKNEIITHTTCKDSLAGSISFDIEGGTAPFTYQWSNGIIATNKVTKLKRGKYQVTITDNNLTLTKEFEIIAPKPIKAFYHHACDLSLPFTQVATLDSFQNASYPISYRIQEFSKQNSTIVNPFIANGVLKTTTDKVFYGNAVTPDIDQYTGYYVIFEDSRGCIDSIADVTAKIKGYTYSNNYPYNGIAINPLSYYVHTGNGPSQAPPKYSTQVILKPLTDTFKTIKIYRNGFPYDCPSCITYCGHENIKCITVPAYPATCDSAFYKIVLSDKYRCDYEIYGFVACKDSTNKESNEAFAYLPTAFSPNDDGINDYFTAFSGGEVTKVLLMQVYDRWGGLLFENQDFEPNVEAYGWNGKQRGTDAPQGNYTYTFRLLLKDGSEKTAKGEVMLMR